MYDDQGPGGCREALLRWTLRIERVEWEGVWGRGRGIFDRSGVRGNFSWSDFSLFCSCCFQRQFVCVFVDCPSFLGVVGGFIFCDILKSLPFPVKIGNFDFERQYSVLARFSGFGTSENRKKREKRLLGSPCFLDFKKSMF